ncbi:hypothetical protein [Solitalea koreensis]|uniref:Uncharacterized protein n=1 Tax=Solitalea koreensis TaxID=543615 RepID=A0A521DKW9_9SPHI|nr:hypothetical protein [Solitalea koreensis]SMO72245.1 hypothetical protein SAMN06265350_10788 [Solitalea koreensis]
MTRIPYTGKKNAEKFREGHIYKYLTGSNLKFMLINLQEKDAMGTKLDIK